MTELDERDLRFDVYTCGGPQCTKPDCNSVKVTHLPSGLSVVASSEKTQLQNKAQAIRQLIKAYEVLSKPIPEEPDMSSLEATDAASEAVRKGFRVTLDDLKARVAEVEYIRREHLTVAVLKLDNGWFLVGKSAPVDPENFNAQHGRDLAYEDALRQLWPLMAFAHLEA